MKEKKLRDMVNLNTKFTYNIKEFLKDLKDDEALLNIKPSEIKYGGLKKIGKINVVMYQEYVLIHDKENMLAILDLYELNSFEIIKDKELVVAYGHEAIALYFLDGTLKKIHTR